METFAEYILEEEDLAAKMEIAYYLAKKRRIYFSKSIVLKTEIARLFLDYAKIDVDKNTILTACLLCNCKKIKNVQDEEKVKAYAKEGAMYLSEIGFQQRFCKMCEEVNRYSKSSPREKESDILELVDQFGSMLIDRPERIGFEPEEALVLLEHRNLKENFNRYLYMFNDFIAFMQSITVENIGKGNALKQLTRMHNETNGILPYIRKVCYEFEPEIDQKIQIALETVAKDMFSQEEKNRPMFTEETTKKVMQQLIENK